MLLENTFRAQFTKTTVYCDYLQSSRKKMFGGTMLPLFSVCTFTLRNQPAGNMVTTLQYHNFYVRMVRDSVQVGTEQLQGCG
jgi:hypothetical protein